VGKKNTLQKAITQLELERKKVNADISYTQNKIGATDLELDKLSLEISTTEKSIALNKRAISETIQALNETDDNSLIEVLLQYDNLSDFWRKIDELEQVRSVMSEKIATLSNEIVLLDSQYDTHTKKRSDLLSLKEQYSDQNEVLVGNKAEKSKLLTATKNEEAEYQKLLSQKKSEYEQILKEMRDFESKLQFILDPNTIPAKGTRVFNWPVENVIITQLFGGTEFAKQNASVYGGRAYHPGVDFGVPVGTKIYAPLAGTVRATGNTDAVPGCYSWGKWTLIDHANGLSTLYAHQSVQSVVAGQQVSTGEVIGYSGNTGYSTGPHLHFTVYAKAGVTIRKFNEIKAVTSCGAATTPIAASDAYIDPMVYLPQ
jgi:murein DD-endopeptidase MepM/ murein hydrolase activator NlpD